MAEAVVRAPMTKVPRMFPHRSLKRAEVGDARPPSTVLFSNRILIQHPNIANDARWLYCFSRTNEEIFGCSLMGGVKVSTSSPNMIESRASWWPSSVIVDFRKDREGRGWSLIPEIVDVLVPFGPIEDFLPLSPYIYQQNTIDREKKLTSQIWCRHLSSHR